MSETWYPAQWTRDLHKKRKVKQDGYVRVANEEATLFQEDKTQVRPIMSIRACKYRPDKPYTSR